MTEVSGPLSVVTEAPAHVDAVWVQAPSLRSHGDGVILPQRTPATLSGSTVTVTCAHGPAVLIWEAGGDEDQVPILVDDVAAQSLAEVVEAARLADGRTRDELASLVAQVVSASQAAAHAAGEAAANRAAVEKAAGQVAGHAQVVSTAAGQVADRAQAVSTAVATAMTARNEAEGFKAQASAFAEAAGEDARSAQLAEGGAGTARDQAQTLVSQANTALDHALAVIADAESLQDVIAALEMVDSRISAAIANLVGTAPEHLDTLGELAAAVEGLDPALHALIAGKLDKSEAAISPIAGTIARRSPSGDVEVGPTPKYAASATPRDWVLSRLTSALEGKANASHLHTMSQIKGLQNSLEEKVDWSITDGSPNGNTVAYRLNTGALAVAPATQPTHAVTKAQLDAKVSAMETMVVSTTTPRMVLHRMGKIVWAELQGFATGITVPNGWRPAERTTFLYPTFTGASQMFIQADGKFSEQNLNLPRIMLTWTLP